MNKLLLVRLLGNWQQISPPSCLSFCPSSTLLLRFHSLLCALRSNTEYKQKYCAIWVTYLLPVTLTFFSTQTFALTAQQRGQQIITEVDKRDTGFGDTKATLKMRLTDRKGNESLRSLKMKTLEIIGDGDKSMTI